MQAKAITAYLHLYGLFENNPEKTSIHLGVQNKLSCYKTLEICTIAAQLL